MIKELPKLKASRGTCTVYVVIFEMVLFLRILRVRSSRKFPLQFMSIYSDENRQKNREINPMQISALVQNRENNGVYSIQQKKPVPIIYRQWGDKTL